MATTQADLERFRRDWIGDLEEQRLAHLTGARPPETQREMSEASTSTLLPMSISGQSTPTMRGRSQTTDPELLDDPTLELDRMNIDSPNAMESPRPEEDDMPLIIATDFGTTFTSVAFARRGTEQRPRVDLITNYPHDPLSLAGRPSVQVATESWYADQSQLDESSLPMEYDEPEEALPEDIDGLSGGEDNESSNNVNSNYGNAMQIDPTPAPAPKSDRPVNFIWGYGIRELLARPDVDHSKYNQISRSKLLLDTSENTERIRVDLTPTLQRLKRRKFIKTDEDVISHYLTEIFLHAKRQLIQHHNLSPRTKIEHVLCVPVVWKAKACRAMQRAMETAITKSGLGTMDGLFLVTEPEAAAAYVLGRNGEVNATEAFLILDAGGGTVDATTYMVNSEYPLRLSKELVEPAGCLNGSSYLNEEFRNFLTAKLQGEEADIEQNGYTLKGIVDAEVLGFEKDLKRTSNIMDPNMPPKRIVIQGLKKNKEKRFENNSMYLNRHDMTRIFIPHLRAIAELMQSQLENAKNADIRVQKVVLIGGFSGSTSLRQYLERKLKELSRLWGYQLRLTRSMPSDEPEIAVAHGAVLRALDKENGPIRQTQSSYGFLRTEPYSQEQHPGMKPRIDPLDGEWYIVDTIDWLIKKGDTISFREERSIPAIHTFSTTERFFRCEEILYVSDICTESHYRRYHPKNKGKFEEAGKIMADMTRLVREGRIKPVEPEEGCTWKRHYKIEFELVMIVEGRNLRFEARWPAGGNVVAENTVSIAAAFRPGTN